MAGYFLTKPNQVSIFKIFRDLIMGVMPQTDPSNGKQGIRNRIKLRKARKRKKRSERHNMYHKPPQECVSDQHMDCDQNMIVIKT